MSNALRTPDYVEATLSFAKAAAFLASAEAGVQHRDLGVASCSAYQSLLHASLGLQWLMADRLPAADRDRLVELRRSGGAALSGVGRVRAQQFLSSGLVPLAEAVPISVLLERFRSLWEFFAEGPILTWPPGHPAANAETPTPAEIVDQVRRLRQGLTTLLRSSRLHIDVGGVSLSMVLRQSAEFMRSPRYPFAGWISTATQQQAIAWLDGLQQESAAA